MVRRKYRRHSNSFRVAAHGAEARRREGELKSESDHGRGLQSQRHTVEGSEFECDEPDCWCQNRCWWDKILVVFTTPKPSLRYWSRKRDRDMFSGLQLFGGKGLDDVTQVSLNAP